MKNGFGINKNFLKIFNVISLYNSIAHQLSLVGENVCFHFFLFFYS